MWNPHSKRSGGDGPWWQAPPERQREAYYMTLRVHYGMRAKDALDYLRINAPKLGLGTPMGFIGKIKQALQGALA